MKNGFINKNICLHYNLYDNVYKQAVIKDIIWIWNET